MPLQERLKQRITALQSIVDGHRDAGRSQDDWPN
jgi:hypothetical protein